MTNVRSCWLQAIFYWCFFITFAHIKNNEAMELISNITLIHKAGWIGTPEIIIIVVIILLLFGGKKIPELMRGMGKGVKEFKEGIGEDAEKKDKNSTDSEK